MQIHYKTIHEYQVEIILPTGYDERLAYPTLYLQDGGNGASQIRNYLDHLMRSGQLEPLLLIGITPLERMTDYTPWPAPALVPTKPAFKGQAKHYLATLVHEIKPFIDREYATNPAPDKTAIGGASLGGLVSYWASYLYPEIFGTYILLSASYWFPGVMDFASGKIVEHAGKSYQKPRVARNNHRFYCSVGELEGFYHQTVQNQMPRFTREIVTSLQEEGVPAKQIRFDTHPEGTHDAYFFSKFLIQALEWLFPVLPQK